MPGMPSSSARETAAVLLQALESDRPGCTPAAPMARPVLGNCTLGASVHMDRAVRTDQAAALGRGRLTLARFSSRMISASAAPLKKKKKEKEIWASKWPNLFGEYLGNSAGSEQASGPSTESYPRTVPDEHLLSLKFVFGSSAIQALDLVDRQSVTLVSSPSGRHVYQVLGSSGKTYTCLASCHYCSCPAFAFSVLRKSDSLLCKHLLAVYLSQVMRTCQQLSVSDKQLTDIILTEKKQEA
ncbi:PREDICTED: zinc finger SWIM domain-containing protein 7 [Galeopterus variegatus]|uniref:Zinc finger SWIM domain-containing protein 7 n=1 Tax=Galeopterus variegatus TaxID=482537 RepID=A0ABM0QKZ5_GALVR|nr:PREDICTED: zinc finger SWIM domain-containing protein 7 [Galeopterus variegatus]